jgi:hypothetical protein
VLKEDIDLVENVQLGLRTRGYRCGPLSRREIAVAWFADRIRADLAEAATAPDRIRGDLSEAATAADRIRGDLGEAATA